MNHHLHLDPDLAYQLEQIRRKCEAERRHAGLLRFGWWMLASTVAADRKSTRLNSSH